MNNSMANRRRYVALVTLLGLGAAVASVIAMAQTGPGVSASGHFRTFFPVVQQAYQPFSIDQFNGPTLHPAWSWTNENPANWSLTEKPGFQRMRTHAGGVVTENLLLMSAPAGDYSVSTRVQFDPSADFQMAGLVFWQEQGTLMMIGPAYCSRQPPACVGKGIYFDHLEGFEAVGGNFPTPIELTDVHLKVERSGAYYTGYYSADGVTWALVGTHTMGPGINLDQIGLATANDIQQHAIPVDFDFFELRAGG
jgi:beta-xylosidase